MTGLANPVKARTGKGHGGAASSVEELRRRVEARPKSVKAKVALATAMIRSGYVDEGVALLASAGELAPHRRSLTRKLAEALGRAGRISESAVAFREWARKPADLPILQKLVADLVAAGEEEQVVLSLERICAIAPHDGEAFLAYGRALAQQGRNEDAASALAEACRIAPAHPRYLREHVSLLSRLRRSDEAIAVAQRLVAASSDSADSLALLGGLLVSARRMAEAEACLRRADEATPDRFHVRLGLAKALRGLSRYEEALEHAEAAVRIAPGDTRALTEEAAALTALGRFEAAIAVEETIVSLSGRSVSTLLRLAKSLAHAGQLERMIGVCDEALLADGANVELHRTRGSALATLARRSEAAAAFETALSIDPDNVSCLVGLALLKQIAGDLDTALTLLDRALALSPVSARLHLTRSEVRYRSGDTEGARRDASLAVSIDPGLARGALYLGFISNSEDAQGGTPIDVCFIEPVAADRVNAARALKFDGDVVFEAIGQAPSIDGAVAGNWRDRISACSSPHVLLVPTSAGSLPGPAAFKSRLGDRVGIIGDDPAGSPCLWRRDLLVEALDVFGEVQFAEFAAVLAPRLARRPLRPSAAPPLPLPEGPLGEGREAWLCSPEGIRLVGGVERYLRSLVPIYRSLGFRPVVVGIVASMAGREAEGVVDDVPFLNVSRSAPALRRLALERNPAVIHATSGVGLELSCAFDGLRARTIYGIHFWSEMFLGNGASYERVDLAAQPRPGFGALAASFDQIYANSDYTAHVLGENFDVGAQRVFPIGVEVDDADGAGGEQPQGGYFLLLAGRPDKGLDFVLDVARQMPGRPFRIVSPLGPSTRTRALVNQADLGNVEVIEWTPDTAALYRAARAVLVPSYRMIETFSRVTIEAQSYGIPVVGSERGNVGVLLADSGTALPEDVPAWRGELERLSADEAYWRSRSARARDNARRFSTSELHYRTRRMIRTATMRLGVGVGCGVGNIVQCTPAIRRISEHFGAPVDVLLSEDFPGGRALLEGSPHVASVLPADRYGPLTRFDTILVFDGFGPLLPRLNADRLLISKEHFNYHRMGPLPESRFNLMCAERLLGVPWRDEDVAAYFVGNVGRRPVPRRIGLHAGCKPGIWLPKRWPHFAELAKRLARRGYELMSFGGADEYVEGTVDATGTDLAATIRGIATCSYFIANDSGLMHVADALGIPLTTVFAPTSVDRYGPIGPASRVVRIDRACSPCQFDIPRLAACVCIADIPVAAVEDDVDAGLAALDKVALPA